MHAIADELSVKRMVVFNGEGSLKAFCDLAIGEMFLIRGVRVIEGKQGLFVSMPRQQGKDGKWYETVAMLSKEVNAEVKKVVLEEYQLHVL